MQTPNTFRGGPDAHGHFGIYGGLYVAETLMPLILAVEAAYNAARADSSFQAELDYYLDLAGCEGEARERARQLSPGGPEAYVAESGWYLLRKPQEPPR